MDFVGRIAVIGGITTVAACFAYVVFGPSQSRKKRPKDTVPGLINMGNWCFMNAVLQSLASCDTLMHWLSKLTAYQNSSNAVSCTQSLAHALMNTLKALNNEDNELLDKVCSALEVLKALKSKGWVISSDEQDAHELFHVLTATLEEEFHAQSFIRSLLDVKGLDYCSEHFEGNRKDVAFRTQSPIKVQKFKQISGSPTKGLLASRLTCKSCGFENPIHYDSFDSISLPIPNRYLGLLSLEDCLNQWSSSELVHGVTCESCSKIHSPHGEVIICKSTFSKQLCIAKLPECLCFHLVRTLWLGSSGVPTKKYDYVVFPEFLSMDRFLLSKKKKCETITTSTGLLGGKQTKNSSTLCDLLLNEKLSVSSQTGDVNARETNSLLSVGNHIFRLKSVIVHMGDTFSGHFVTYRRGPSNSQLLNSWFYTSDTIVRQVSVQEVMKSNAYMLIYERIIY